VAALATGLGLAAAGCSAGQVTQTDTQVAVVNGAEGRAGNVTVRDAQLLFPAAHGSYEEGDDAPVMVVIANNGTTPDKLLAVTSDAASQGEITGDSVLEASSAILGEADEHDAGNHATTTTGKPSVSGSPSATTTPSVPGSVSGSVSGSATPTTTTGSAASGTSSASPSSEHHGTSISQPPTSSTKLPSSVDPSEPGVVKIVLKGLKKKLRPGETIRVTFLFQNAGEVTLDLPIGATSEPRQDAPAEH
jgi:copper(I)-binding protein